MGRGGVARGLPHMRGVRGSGSGQVQASPSYLSLPALTVPSSPTWGWTRVSPAAGVRVELTSPLPRLAKALVCPSTGAWALLLPPDATQCHWVTPLGTDPQKLSTASAGWLCQMPASWPERGQCSPSGFLGQSGLLVRAGVGMQPNHSVPGDSFLGQCQVAEGCVHGSPAPHSSDTTENAFLLSAGNCLILLSELRHLFQQVREGRSPWKSLDVFPCPAHIPHLWKWRLASPLENHPPIPHSQSRSWDWADPIPTSTSERETRAGPRRDFHSPGHALNQRQSQ